MNAKDLIPAQGIADSYENRHIEGFSDFDVYQAAMTSGHNVLLNGPTGSGKTHSARAFAASKGLPYYTVGLNGSMDMGTVIGGWQPTPDGSLEWGDGVVTALAREGKGVVLLDEINMATERNMARLYGLLDARREIVLYEHQGEVVRVPAESDFLLIAAQNPGYRGTRELSQALTNRFAFKLNFDYDTEIESGLVGSAAVQEAAGKLRDMAREVRTPVSTNMLIELVEVSMAFSVPFGIANFCASFSEGERNSVAQVMGLYERRIQDDIKLLAAEGSE